jgi:ribA/ribD-fused uncharacterized protein
MRITDKAIYFWGTADIYSNWYPAPTGVFANSEQAFMWYKADFFGDEEIKDKIFKETNPAEAKKLGRLVKGFDAKAWECVKFGLMTYVNLLKFQQNSELGQNLRDTGDRILVEASPVDNIWGVGLGANDDKILDPANWKGQNLLGQALIQVRKLIT